MLLLLSLPLHLKSLKARKTGKWGKKFECKVKRNIDKIDPTGKWNPWGQTKPLKDSLEFKSLSASNSNNVTKHKSVPFCPVLHMLGLGLKESKGRNLTGAIGTEVRLLPSISEVIHQINHNTCELQWCLGLCTNFVPIIVIASLLPSKSHSNFHCDQSPYKNGNSEKYVFILCKVTQ